MLETSLAVSVGATVEFRLRVVNAGDTPIELTFPDACRADFAVLEEGTEIWRYSDGRAFEQSTYEAELMPGESAAFEQTWPDSRPGHFTAEAVLRALESGQVARTPFSV